MAVSNQQTGEIMERPPDGAASSQFSTYSMKSLWTDAEAGKYQSDLALRVYTSQLLGRDPSLVLHGGGNTSVKIREKNVLGEQEDFLYVKGSGWDLETIQEAGFSPVRMRHVSRLAQLEALSDPQMMNELTTQLARAVAPAPSVETILHAILPHKYVDHTHADALLAATNTADSEARIREIYGKDVVIIPYVMPGFDLARLCAQKFAAEAHPGTQGMVLMNHGIFSFGDTARQSYERMIALVARAEEYLVRNGAQATGESAAEKAGPPIRRELATLRNKISVCAGFPVIMSTHSGSRYLAFAQRPDVERLSQQGPATPDHVIRTKRVPLLGRDVEAFAEAYRKYFERNAPLAKESKTMLDPAPRVVLDPKFGMGCIGRTARDARIVHDLYSHTIDIILSATALGGYRALSEKDIFDVEYWDLEQAKLRKAGKAPVFTGEVALVTGAASGIGKACVEALLRRGAAVIGLDVNIQIVGLMGTRPDFLGLCCDVCSPQQLTEALEAGVRAFGGLDILILNAGIFPGGARIDALLDDEWRRVMQVNLDANLSLLRECHALLELAPNGGRVVVVGSKNVPAPGPGAAAYSASKAALTQLARVAALEWGAQGIRVNTIHPNAVFDTALWTDEVLAARAKHYGLTVDEYRRNNVLKTEVRSLDVAELAAEMCGPLFAKTTGAQVPVDGGNERVI
jgi:rhamnose utilization protein RhaD (predicted bifunctional aldolase and dehydrogenase)/NAD(P)-dependent dehydrogenase (short-subunit alcohol dehydrogenase family)